MTKLLSIIPCMTAVVDFSTGNVSLQNIIEKIQIPQVPISVPLFLHIFLLLRTDKEIKIRISIKYKGIGNHTILSEKILKISEGNNLVKADFIIQSLKIMNFGPAEFYCEIYEDNKWRKFDTVFIIDIDKMKRQSKLIVPKAMA